MVAIDRCLRHTIQRVYARVLMVEYEADPSHLPRAFAFAFLPTAMRMGGQGLYQRGKSVISVKVNRSNILLLIPECTSECILPRKFPMFTPTSSKSIHVCFASLVAKSNAVLPYWAQGGECKYNGLRIDDSSMPHAYCMEIVATTKMYLSPAHDPNP